MTNIPLIDYEHRSNPRHFDSIRNAELHNTLQAARLGASSPNVSHPSKLLRKKKNSGEQRPDIQQSNIPASSKQSRQEPKSPTAYTLLSLFFLLSTTE